MFSGNSNNNQIPSSNIPNQSIGSNTNMAQTQQQSFDLFAGPMQQPQQQSLFTNAQTAMMNQAPYDNVPQSSSINIQMIPQPHSMNSFFGFSQPVHSNNVLNSSPFNDDEILAPPLAKTNVKSTKPYDLEKSLQLKVKAKQNVIKLSSSKAQTLPVMINVKTEELTQ
jgi:hypothetical protein